MGHIRVRTLQLRSLKLTKRQVGRRKRPSMQQIFCHIQTSFVLWGQITKMSTSVLRGGWCLNTANSSRCMNTSSPTLFRRTYSVQWRWVLSADSVTFIRKFMGKFTSRPSPTETSNLATFSYVVTCPAALLTSVWPCAVRR